MKLRLAKASQLSWSWGLAWLSLAITMGQNPINLLLVIFSIVVALVL